MRIDAGLIIGVALEFIIMLYFANSTYKRKLLYKLCDVRCGVFNYVAFHCLNQCC